MIRAVVCSVILAVIVPSFAHAAGMPRTTLGVSPAITEWLAAPGATLQKEVLVTNTTDEPLPISALARPFRLQETDAIDLAGAPRYNASAWLKVKDKDFILRPGKTRHVTVELTVPKNASPGGHYATVYFRQLRPAGTTGAEAQVGTLAFVTVKGKVVKKVQGRALSAWWRDGTLTIKATLRNTGNVHDMPKGEFAVLNWYGTEVKKVSLPQGMVMPQTSRAYQTALKHLGYGVYTIKPVLSYGDNQPLDLPNVIVWAIPWKIPVLLLLLAAAGWFGVYRIKDRWKRAFFVLTRHAD